MRKTATEVTQRTDDAAVLLSKLDAVMKGSAPPRGPAGPSPVLPLAKRMTSAVSKMLSKDAVAPAGEMPGDEKSSVPVGWIGAAVGALLVVGLLLMLRPWTGTSQGGVPELSPAELFAADELRKLAPLLTDEAAAVRRHALSAIRRNCRTASGEVCAINALRDADVSVRVEAARTIADLKRKGAALRIVSLLDDRSPEVRGEAARMLVELTQYQSLTRIDWHTAAESLRKAYMDEFLEWLRSQPSL
jgi:hypothetical protein